MIAVSAALQFSAYEGLALSNRLFGPLKLYEFLSLYATEHVFKNANLLIDIAGSKLWRFRGLGI